MSTQGQRCRSAGATILVVAVLLTSVVWRGAARAQEPSGERPDVATLEAAHEEAFAQALALSDGTEPMWVLSAWGSVMMSATILDRAQRINSGQDPSSSDANAVADRVLNRWQALRPDSAGPDLFRTFRIEDPEEKRSATLAVLNRYPDDPLAVSQAIRELRQAGEDSRSIEIAEDFVSRNAESAIAYRTLARAVEGNQTRYAEALEQWARAVPGDPELVRAWMRTRLPQQDPRATERVLNEFFDRRPAGAAGLQACRAVMQKGDPVFAEAARTCLARMAADPESDPTVSSQAMKAVAEMAAAEGNWSALLDALDRMEPDARKGALIGAASRLEAPQGCSDRVELLALAAETLEGDDGAYGSISSSLNTCSEFSAARDLFLTLLRRAPAERTLDVVSRWIWRVNDVYRGEAPYGTARILEQRLRDEAPTSGLFRALDTVYRVDDPEGKRFDLLLRWHEQDPSSFRAEQSTALAWMLIQRGDPQAAVGFLEQQVETGFSTEAAELLWGLYYDAGDSESADRLAAQLIASDGRWRARTGHLLTARSAAAMGDLAVAERHYWMALEGDYPDKEVAVELLFALAMRGDVNLETTAQRLCQETKLAQGSGKVTECSVDLLARVGGHEAATDILAGETVEFPDDLESLRKLASNAEKSGQLAVAERALQRILELDPRDSSSWTVLGGFLERQGRVEELEDLLERSRELFSPPPVALYRATGRALSAAGQPQRAVAVLKEARAGLSEGAGGDWSRSWINHELRRAYSSLGSEVEQAAPARARVRVPVPMASFATSDPVDIPEGNATELLVTAEALQSGKDGKYDPDTAMELFSRAAALGDPAASFRLALLQALGRGSTRVDLPDAQELYGRSARAVEALASDGDGYAQYLVGTAALIGLGRPANMAVSRRWLERAAPQGESWAWHNLAWMQETGRGFDNPDPALALDLYRGACELGNVVSMFDFARLTLVPFESQKLCDEGLRWLERSSQSGNARSAARLGKVLLYGQRECVTAEPPASLGWLKAAAETHQPGATYDLAMAWLLAGQDEASRNQGLTLLEQQADQQSALTTETLAFLYATGIAGPRDPARAARLMEEAARLGSDGFHNLRRDAAVSPVIQTWIDEGTRILESLARQGDLDATTFLAQLYFVGLGPEVDPEHAISLALEAAGKGDGVAMRILARAYKQGFGVRRDSSESLLWKRRGAEAGDSFCMMFYGNELLEGKEIERDLESGVSWLRRAAETGNWWAVQDLGRLYDEGRFGFPRDPEEAAVWKRRLADLGSPEAIGWLESNGYR